MTTIPQSLQSVLWSADVNRLDPEKDKSYIIHQILAYGSLEDIFWVFRNYPKNEIMRTFLTHPYKDYRAPRFYFVKNYLLNLKRKSMNEKRYVKNIPRDIR